MQTEVSVKMEQTKVFESFDEITADPKFKEFLVQTIKKALNPPAPPSGRRYRSEPWKRLKAFGLNDPEKLMLEFELINSLKSVESSIVRNYISEIVRDAAQQTILHYFEPEKA